MSDVIDINKGKKKEVTTTPEEEILSLWACENCGNFGWFIYSDFTLECMLCNTTVGLSDIELP